jgi:hypothetical protein
LSKEVLISCMAYVDLNPIRASICNKPEASDHSSIIERIAPSFDLKKATDGEIWIFFSNVHKYIFRAISISV